MHHSTLLVYEGVGTYSIKPVYEGVGMYSIKASNDTSQPQELEMHLEIGHTLLPKKLVPDSLEMIEASRPIRCPLPSMTMGVEEKVSIVRIAADFAAIKASTSNCTVRPEGW